MKKVLSFLVAISLVIGMSGAALSAVSQINYSTLTGTAMIDFDDLPTLAAPGVNYDTIFQSGGALFGEHFLGQTVTYNGDFDVINGSPSGGSLTMLAGPTNENLNTFLYSGSGSNVLTGLGQTGFPNSSAIGEGAFSVLFDDDQSEFGFQLVGGNQGSATIDFFDRTGSLLSSIGLVNLADAYYGFESDSGNDIAGISVYNLDLAGIGFDNLRHDVQGTGPAGPVGVVPIPGAVWLLGSGLIGLTGLKRKLKK
jgi:hypothetical protein